MRRYNIQGVRDYTGVSLEDMIGDIKDWYAENQASIQKLARLNDLVEENYEKLENPDSIKDYIEHIISLLRDYEADYKRLLLEIPQEVTQRHIEIIDEIETSSKNEEKLVNREFKLDHIVMSLKDESMRPLLDDIYETSGNILIHNICMAAMNRRLKTYIGTKLGYKKGSETIFTQDAPLLDIPDGTYSRDIEMRFLDKEMVEIKIARKPYGAKKYAVLGFEDKRQHRPNSLWHLLIIIAQNNGEVPWNRQYGFDTKTKKEISRLRKKLISTFQLQDDPIIFHKRDRIYKAMFTIKCEKDL